MLRSNWPTKNGRNNFFVCVCVSFYLVTVLGFFVLFCCLSAVVFCFLDFGGFTVVLYSLLFVF